MADTSRRALQLLSLLATGRRWPLAELAARLGVGERTVRRDIQTLRLLDYPVTTTLGPSGGYRLDTSHRLPPLLLDDDQALAVAVALQTAPTTVFGLEDDAARALDSLTQNMPARLRVAMESLPLTRLPNYWEFPAPPIDRRLVSLASAILLLTIPFAHHWGIERLPDGLHVPHALIDKNNFGPLRYVHFLALAYLAYAAAGPGGVHLRGQLVSLCCKVGQQSLAVFIAGIVFSLMGGIALARIGYSISMVTAVNLAGFGGLIVVAYTGAWFKSKPWAMKRMATSSAAPSQSQAAE